MKQILLTGGAGYIGSHTAVELLNSGYDVIIADNFSNSDKQVITRIEKITGKRPKCYKMDVSDCKRLRDVFLENDIDAVIHFAGYKAVGESVEKPLTYYKNNLYSVISVLEVMQEFKVNKFIFSSSATVYGVPEKMPIDEAMKTGCTNPYGWTKLMAEQILQDTAVANKDISVVLLRYFNPIGAHRSGIIGESPQGIPANLMAYVAGVAIGELEKLRIFGDDYPTHDGTGVRDYIHVVDLARGHLKALEYADKHSGIDVFNLGTGRGYSVMEIIQTFERVNHVSVPYVITKRRAGDVAECYADPKKANDLLGWKAELDLEDMCRDVWRWQKYRHNELKRMQ